MILVNLRSFEFELVVGQDQCRVIVSLECSCHVKTAFKTVKYECFTVFMRYSQFSKFDLELSQRWIQGHGMVWIERTCHKDYKYIVLITAQLVLPCLTIHMNSLNTLARNYMWVIVPNLQCYMTYILQCRPTYSIAFTVITYCIRNKQKKMSYKKKYQRCAKPAAEFKKNLWFGVFTFTANSYINSLHTTLSYSLYRGTHAVKKKENKKPLKTV